MLMCDRGVQMLITTVGAFAAFSLMTIAVGTDYWLYSRGVCRVKSNNENETSRKNEEVMTHSGLWRTCCLEGTFRGVCKKIDHFPEDADYEQDAAEYLLRLSNIIGIIVYISANSGDPGQSDSKKSYSYGWSFYFGALSFIMAEMVGVLAVHMFIEKHRKLRTKSRTELIKKSAFSRIPSYRYRFRRRSSCRSSEPASRDASPMGKSGYTGPAAADISMYTLSRDPSKAAMGALLNSEREFLQAHNSNAKDFKDAANRRTTPV
ncbi:voltage-dependent calcium channel gamma-3 subunit-like isoform X2 [Sinocyclocheilus anshuiensis]|uniref:voltage-dependent calcium channel gamma-3 subunit-like n=1 Tax=Sinocyclocheilus grahami TaxID=75366 RepID=UPI0007AD4AEC|nr:PREDICTED: voltage-dependent calcium channel gamma-3 subunit-like [Sinocyclocheilus grahami]XP_016343150.1 PREDICTED: voltage-dependent calcium channel gamma-3 subunit-like isoform X2 [Sinocyclocheilus anshuiensis]XP_016370165.1 PREDICTED: voltage-dependent calcium channel gamma-3 subunit-like isoform X2 [Sinocyclocheilus rhinocerous]